MTRYATIPSPVDELLLVGDGDALTGVYFADHRRGPAVAGEWERDDDAFAAAAEAFADYFACRPDPFASVATAPRGTDFQLRVWQRLRAIPAGRTATYAKIAADIGRPSATRAVAGAVARNPLSIVVPCHRVVGASGALTGFAGGLARKRVLLDLEAGRGPRPGGQRAVGGSVSRWPEESATAGSV